MADYCVYQFPKNFAKTVKNIYKRLFRLYAHIFHTHFGEVEARGAEAHLNSSFKHLMYFILEFDLVEEAELAPLKNLIKILTDKQINEAAAAPSSD
jgi:MOB kinase activator 1